MNLKGKKFVAAYSGGKNSVLAIYKAIKQGMIPVGLITTFNDELNRSWFHGLNQEILNDASSSLNIPIFLIHTDSQHYRENFLKELMHQKELGAEVCVFGDNNNEKHLSFGKSLCEEANLYPYFPLDDLTHEEIVNDLIELGFVVNLTIINIYRLDSNLLGKTLSKEMLETFKKKNINICGENSEYQTFVSDGPLFRYPIKFAYGEKILKSPYKIIEIRK